MSSIFTRGVRKKSEQLRALIETLSILINEIDRKADIGGFAQRYPNQLAGTSNDLKEARRMMHRAIERLNFPDQIGTP